MKPAIRFHYMKMFTLDTANEDYLAAERHYHQGAASRKQAHP